MIYVLLFDKERKWIELNSINNIFEILFINKKKKEKIINNEDILLLRAIILHRKNFIKKEKGKEKELFDSGVKPRTPHTPHTPTATTWDIILIFV